MSHLTIGSITSGSLTRGLTAQLRATEDAPAVRVGAGIVIDDAGDQYFGLVSDLELTAQDAALTHLPIASGGVADAALRASGALAMTALLKPSLMIPSGSAAAEPVRTLPRHYAPVRLADADDYAQVFGDPNAPGMFAVGSPPGVEIALPIDLKRFVERSNGIFGRTGTGKSMLTRLMLAGILQRDAAVTLVFDAHNEYGWAGAEGVKGLRQLFPGKVLVYTLDAESSRRRGAKIDGELTLAWEDITLEDLELLRGELNLADGALDNVELLRRKFRDGWLRGFTETDAGAVLDLADELHANPQSLVSFHRKLQRLGRLPILGAHATSDQVVDALLAGKSVVIEFGAAKDVSIKELLVANVLTRALHEAYVNRCEAAKTEGDKPRQLVIAVEEAHRFLSPETRKLTTFGTIAREMRKYNTTLLIIDQRPSSIDREVLSQIGTRIIALLTDEADLDAALIGQPDPQKLRGIVASLDSQQQALLLGHALPMPVVVRTRSYDATFYKELAATGATAPLVRAAKKGAAKKRPSGDPPAHDDQAAIDALFGDA